MDDNLPRTSGSQSTGNQGGMRVIPPTAASSGTVVGKELEKTATGPEAYLEEAEKVPELPPEVEKAGVQSVSGEVTIPPQVSKMGVKQAGPTAPVSGQVLVKLPITDEQVLKGLHASIFDALRWLSEWCLRRLKQAHMALKKIHGRVMRIPAK